MPLILRSHIVWWGVAALAGMVGLGLATPERVGQAAWLSLRWPLVGFVGISWVGFLLTCLVYWSRSKAPEQDGQASSVPLGRDEILVVRQSLKARLALAALLLVCVAMAVRGVFFHYPPTLLLALIWASGAVVIAWQIWRTALTRAVFSPDNIAWGRSYVKRYRDLTAVETTPGGELKLVFQDGKKLYITADMADLGVLRATIADRQWAERKHR